MPIENKEIQQTIKANDTSAVGMFLSYDELSNRTAIPVEDLISMKANGWIHPVTLNGQEQDFFDNNILETIHELKTEYDKWAELMNEDNTYRVVFTDAVTKQTIDVITLPITEPLTPEHFPDIPTHDDFKFTGWSTGKSKDGSIIYTAQYTHLSKEEIEALEEDDTDIDIGEIDQNPDDTDTTPEIVDDTIDDTEHQKFDFDAHMQEAYEHAAEMQEKAAERRAKHEKHMRQNRKNMQKALRAAEEERQLKMQQAANRLAQKKAEENRLIEARRQLLERTITHTEINTAIYIEAAKKKKEYEKLTAARRLENQQAQAQITEATQRASYAAYYYAQQAEKTEQRINSALESEESYRSQADRIAQYNARLATEIHDDTVRRAAGINALRLSIIEKAAYYRECVGQADGRYAEMLAYASALSSAPVNDAYATASLTIAADYRMEQLYQSMPPAVQASLEPVYDRYHAVNKSIVSDAMQVLPVETPVNIIHKADEASASYHQTHYENSQYTPPNNSTSEEYIHAVSQPTYEYRVSAAQYQSSPTYNLQEIKTTYEQYPKSQEATDRYSQQNGDAYYSSQPTHAENRYTNPVTSETPHDDALHTARAYNDTLTRDQEAANRRAEQGIGLDSHSESRHAEYENNETYQATYQTAYQEFRETPIEQRAETVRQYIEQSGDAHAVFNAYADAIRHDNPNASYEEYVTPLIHSYNQSAEHTPSSNSEYADATIRVIRDYVPAEQQNEAIKYTLDQTSRHYESQRNDDSYRDALLVAAVRSIPEGENRTQYVKTVDDIVSSYAKHTDNSTVERATEHLHDVIQQVPTRISKEEYASAVSTIASAYTRHVYSSNPEYADTFAQDAVKTVAAHSSEYATAAVSGIVHAVEQRAPEAAPAVMSRAVEYASTLPPKQRQEYMSSVVSGYVNADKGIAATPSAHRTEEAVCTIYEIAPKERRAEYIAYVASSAVAQQHTPEQTREAVSRVFNAIKETVPFDDQARYLKTAAQAQVQATAHNPEALNTVVREQLTATPSAHLESVVKQQIRTGGTNNVAPIISAQMSYASQQPEVAQRIVHQQISTANTVHNVGEAVRAQLDNTPPEMRSQVSQWQQQGQSGATVAQVQQAQERYVHSTHKADESLSHPNESVHSQSGEQRSETHQPHTYRTPETANTHTSETVTDKQYSRTQDGSHESKVASDGSTTRPTTGDEHKVTPAGGQTEKPSGDTTHRQTVASDAPVQGAAAGKQPEGKVASDGSTTRPTTGDEHKVTPAGGQTEKTSGDTTHRQTVASDTSAQGAAAGKQPEGKVASDSSTTRPTTGDEHKVTPAGGQTEKPSGDTTHRQTVASDTSAQGAAAGKQSEGKVASDGSTTRPTTGDRHKETPTGGQTEKTSGDTTHRQTVASDTSAQGVAVGKQPEGKVASDGSAARPTTGDGHKATPTGGQPAEKSTPTNNQGQHQSGTKPTPTSTSQSSSTPTGVNQNGSSKPSPASTGQGGSSKPNPTGTGQGGSSKSNPTGTGQGGSSKSNPTGTGQSGSSKPNPTGTGQGGSGNTGGGSHHKNGQPNPGGTGNGKPSKQLTGFQKASTAVVAAYVAARTVARASRVTAHQIDDAARTSSATKPLVNAITNAGITFTRVQRQAFTNQNQILNRIRQATGDPHGIIKNQMVSNYMKIRALRNAESHFVNTQSGPAGNPYKITSTNANHWLPGTRGFRLTPDAVANLRFNIEGMRSNLHNKSMQTDGIANFIDKNISQQTRIIQQIHADNKQFSALAKQLKANGKNLTHGTSLSQSDINFMKNHAPDEFNRLMKKTQNQQSRAFKTAAIKSFLSDVKQMGGKAAWSRLSVKRAAHKIQYGTAMFGGTARRIGAFAATAALKGLRNITDVDKNIKTIHAMRTARKRMARKLGASIRRAYFMMRQQAAKLEAVQGAKALREYAIPLILIYKISKIAKNKEKVARLTNIAKLGFDAKLVKKLNKLNQKNKLGLLGQLRKNRIQLKLTSQAQVQAALQRLAINKGIGINLGNAKNNMDARKAIMQNFQGRKGFKRQILWNSKWKRIGKRGKKGGLALTANELGDVKAMALLNKSNKINKKTRKSKMSLKFEIRGLLRKTLRGTAFMEGLDTMQKYTRYAMMGLRATLKVAMFNAKLVGKVGKFVMKKTGLYSKYATSAIGRHRAWRKNEGGLVKGIKKKVGKDFRNAAAKTGKRIANAASKRLGRSVRGRAIKGAFKKIGKLVGKIFNPMKLLMEMLKRIFQAIMKALQAAASALYYVAFYVALFIIALFTISFLCYTLAGALDSLPGWLTGKDDGKPTDTIESVYQYIADECESKNQQWLAEIENYANMTPQAVMGSAYNASDFQGYIDPTTGQHHLIDKFGYDVIIDTPGDEEHEGESTTHVAGVYTQFVDGVFNVVPYRSNTKAILSLVSAKFDGNLENAYNAMKDYALGKPGHFLWWPTGSEQWGIWYTTHAVLGKLVSQGDPIICPGCATMTYYCDQQAQIDKVKAAKDGGTPFVETEFPTVYAQHGCIQCMNSDGHTIVGGTTDGGTSDYHYHSLNNLASCNHQVTVHFTVDGKNYSCKVCAGHPGRTINGTWTECGHQHKRQVSDKTRTVRYKKDNVWYTVNVTVKPYQEYYCDGHCDGHTVNYCLGHRTLLVTATVRGLENTCCSVHTKNDECPIDSESGNKTHINVHNPQNLESTEGLPREDMIIKGAYYSETDATSNGHNNTIYGDDGREMYYDFNPNGTWICPNCRFNGTTALESKETANASLVDRETNVSGASDTCWNCGYHRTNEPIGRYFNYNSSIFFDSGFLYAPHMRCGPADPYECATYEVTNEQTDDEDDKLFTVMVWDRDHVARALEYYHQDWYATYGVQIGGVSGSESGVYSTSPLSEAEIQEMLASIAPGTEQYRIALIEYALRSVGRVPYYFGGMSVHKGYLNKPAYAKDGQTHNFGDYVSVGDSVEKDRHFAGLDCSHWTCWCFRSYSYAKYYKQILRPCQDGVQYYHLKNQSTFGLKSIGLGINKADLKAGDLLVINDGVKGHVGIFISWANPEHTLMNFVHETGGSCNNATLQLNSNRQWTFYRRVFYDGVNVNMDNAVDDTNF